MPRPPRIIEPNVAYHVITRGNDRRDIFYGDRDRVAYISILREMQEKFCARFHHYVLMSNHVHLIMSFDEAAPLPFLMQKIDHSYSLWNKKQSGRIGQFWQGRYKNFLINDDSYLLTCGAYIELNPVRAGICRSPEEYRWSSYRHYAFGEKNPLITDNIVYSTLGVSESQRRSEYQNFVLNWMN